MKTYIIPHLKMEELLDNEHIVLSVDRALVTPYDFVSMSKYENHVNIEFYSDKYGFLWAVDGITNIRFLSDENIQKKDLNKKEPDSQESIVMTTKE